MPLLHLLRQNPVIAAVKDNASLQLAIDSECQFISVLYGNICTISNIVKKIKNAGKYAFIHVDLLEGASNKEVVIQFLKLVTEADGIISTKASMLKAAGGLVCDEEDARNAINAGVVALSTTNTGVWTLAKKLL